jgi:U-box domain
VQVSDTAAQPYEVALSTEEEAQTSCNGVAAADALQLDAAQEMRAPAGSTDDSLSCAANQPLQQPAAPLGQASATADWWRCPLSGRVMRDPVLCGSEGHSFERAALEEWLADNPGVEPLTRQPLPPGRGGVLPNHALRNMIQQLHIA